MKPKIVTLDLETLPLEGWFWRMFGEINSLDFVKKDWAIYSGAAKWLGSSKVEYFDTRHEGSPYDDFMLLQWLHAILDEADIVVGQNIKSFDLKKIRARMVRYGFAPFKEPMIVDTKLMAKEVGGFTSNKLQYLAEVAGSKKLKHSKFPGFEMWKAILDGNEEAWEESRKYNIQDVVSTEQVYLMLRPWVSRTHPNMGLFRSKEDITVCRSCGSEELEARGTVARGLKKYTMYSCLDCGSVSRARGPFTKLLAGL